jgi:hypothetical protein
MNQVQLYNLYSQTSNAYGEAKNAQDLIIMMNVLHLRLEHNMPLHKIAKRCGIKVNKVKLILFNYQNEKLSNRYE